MRDSLFLLSALLVLGCSTFGLSDGELDFAYRFETTHSRFAIEDTIRATFINQSPQTLYVSWRTCLLIEMDRLEESTWEPVTLPVICTMEVKPPVKVEPGEEIETKLAPHLLSDAGLGPGVYRLRLAVSNEKGEGYVEVASNRFTLVEADVEE